MEPPEGAAFSVLVVLLFAVLAILRVRCPNASKGSETAALVITVTLFFSLGYLFLPR